MDYEPLFCHEERQALRLATASSIRVWLSKHRISSADVGVTLSLLLLAAGFRHPEAVREVQQAVEQVVVEGARVAKAASSNALSALCGTSSWSSSGSNAAAAAIAAAATTRDRANDGDARHQGHQSRDIARSGSSSQVFTRRIAAFLVNHLDEVLLSVLGYKLAMLVLYTMPISYGFGIKRLFLRWASRATTFRLYLQVAPALGFALVAAAFGVVRSTKHPLQPGTVQRWRMLALTNTVLTYCTRRLFELIRGDPTQFIHIEETAHDRDLLSVQPPPLNVQSVVTWPYRRLCPPRFFGLEDLPRKTRLLFVGNHALLGLDVPLLLHGLTEQAGIWARPLGEHAWFSVPFVGEVMQFIGAVDGTRHNCDLLMARGDNLLVYPGGAREAWKRTTDAKYSLMWGEHVGFARMAVRHSYSIVPVATVGTEDFFEPVVDLPIQKILTMGGVLGSPAQGTSKAFDKGARLPVVRPRLAEAQAVYYRFMPPVETDAYYGLEGDEKSLRDVRDLVRDRLQEGIDWLLEHRKTDPQRYTFSRVNMAAPRQSKVTVDGPGSSAFGQVDTDSEASAAADLDEAVASANAAVNNPASAAVNAAGCQQRQLLPDPMPVSTRSPRDGEDGPAYTALRAGKVGPSAKL